MCTQDLAGEGQLAPNPPERRIPKSPDLMIEIPLQFQTQFLRAVLYEKQLITV